MRDADRKPESSPPDPDQLAQLLEIELMQKRAGWQRLHARNRSLRTAAVLFLLVVIAAAFAAYFLFVANAPQRPEDAQQPSPVSATKANP